MDLTFTPDSEKAARIAKELDCTKEEAQYIVGLRAHLLPKIDNKSAKGLALTMYALGFISGQVAEALEDNVSEAGVPNARRAIRKTFMDAYDGALEESAIARARIGRMQ